LIEPKLSPEIGVWRTSQKGIWAPLQIIASIIFCGINFYSELIANSFGSFWAIWTKKRRAKKQP
jgi:hypothetical protein